MNKANHEEAVGLGGPEFHLPIEQGKVREFARTLFAFRPDYLEERHPPMFPTQTVVAGYSWGYMLEDPQDTDLAKVEINPFMSLDAEQEGLVWISCRAPGSTESGRNRAARAAS